MAVTIKDVAKQANVSISTVSRVINKSKPVSDEVRERVEEVIEELGYKPNPIARSLVMKKTNLLGVIVPDISSFFIGEVLNAIEQIAKIYDYDIILCNSYADLQQEMKYLNLLKEKHVEGIVFISFKIEDEHKKFIKDNQLPVVMINRYVEDIDMLSVTIDHEKAAYEATKHLIETGNKTIVLIRNGYSDDVFMNDQLIGYKKALEENDIAFDETLVYDGIFKIDGAYDIVNNIIEQGEVPDAIFATSDDTAVGAMNCLMDHGFKIPEDIQVAGFHNTKIANLFRPKLTAISQPIFDIGSVATRMLIKKINDEPIEGQIKIMPHALVVRESTKEK
jgi:LacI family transcriptional regulator